MLESYFGETRKGDYQRKNFDNFLKDINFKFELPAVHIAGTNGKGSVANFLNAVFKNEGYKVGMFISPYFYEINELIRVNNELIPDKEIEEIYNEYKAKIAKHNLSNFEIETFIAFTYFSKQNCDICFIECGMGGEKDATNIFKPILSIITSVGLEHTNYLGKTRAEIAYSKAGIIKQFIPCVIGGLNNEAEEVIKNVCVERKSKLFEMRDPYNMSLDENGFKFSYGKYKDVLIKSPTIYTLRNACVALEAIDALSDRYSFKNEGIISSFLVDNLPGRFTILGENKNIIIDGAHNPQATNELKDDITNYALNRPIHIIFASFTDKNLMNMMMNLGETTKQITLTTFPNPRARTEDDYFLYTADYEFIEDPMVAFNKIRAEFPEDIILITGSLAFAGFMLKKIKDIL